MFPTSLTLAGLIEQVVGWLLVGAAMAWWLGRRNKAGMPDLAKARRIC